ncbi:MAG: ribonuclease D [Planctomycetaceae bacterium]|nr:ribonuclease D [Planctomycetaceae bacterium]MBT4886507.1 ribonuclease D [Planctomycetaceae bacterium]MBT6054455.1 ribonuclease D [Planctomycetaceae bacterium]MBT6459536.1 ribonuclease D [Planctomycetaceae bacterium]MBT7728379.1 ribonuclease D [Planctomycetaceae bacterium]
MKRSQPVPSEHDFITTESQLASLVERLDQYDSLGFDTEFVSEHTYRSQLCLIQVAAGDVLAVIDTLKVQELEPFWRLMTDPKRTTVVHAGREEMGFILHAIGERPAHLFDVQVAAGLVDHDYPAGYASVVRRVLGQPTNKGETRTDWRKRPLTPAQIEYALDDVRYLDAIWKTLETRLEDRGRTAWMQEEMLTWMDEVAASFTRKRWRRVSGLNGLKRRELAVARELWHWRDSLAESRDMPPKRVLRDDLIVELCKRKNTDPQQIAAVRGMQRSDLRHILPSIADAIERGLALPDDELPGGERHKAPPPQLNVLGQFLATAVGGLCRQLEIAPSLVGTASDMRELLAYKLGHGQDEAPPTLTTGWRAEVVGDLIDDLLAGKASLRISDLTSRDPLVIDRTESHSPPEDTSK